MVFCVQGLIYSHQHDLEIKCHMSISLKALNISIPVTSQLVENFCKLCWTSQFYKIMFFLPYFIISFNVGFLIFICIILEKNEGITNIAISRNKTRFLYPCTSKTIQMNYLFLWEV
jgi:hypothetical protein